MAGSSFETAIEFAFDIAEIANGAMPDADYVDVVVGRSL
jgi:hypothetical protein